MVACTLHFSVGFQGENLVLVLEILEFSSLLDNGINLGYKICEWNTMYFTSVLWPITSEKPFSFWFFHFQLNKRVAWIDCLLQSLALMINWIDDISISLCKSGCARGYHSNSIEFPTVSLWALYKHQLIWILIRKTSFSSSVIRDAKCWQIYYVICSGILYLFLFSQ